jgi:hypothetical protein
LQSEIAADEIEKQKEIINNIRFANRDLNEQFELTKSKLSEIESSNLKLVAQTQNLEEEREKLLFEKSLAAEHSKLNNIVNMPLLKNRKTRQ